MKRISGFYYSAKTTTCYLPGNGGMVTPASNAGSGTFCEQYKSNHRSLILVIPFTKYCVLAEEKFYDEFTV